MQGFDTFGAQHLLWLLILAVSGAAVVFLIPARAGAVGAVLAVMGRVVPAACAAMEGSYGISSLPLHVCSLAGYACFIHFLTAPDPSGILSELLYFPGLIGGVMALIFPGWGYLPPFSLISCCEFLGHAGIVLYVLAGLRSGMIRPSGMKVPVIFCILYAAVMLPFDRATGMDYGFLQVPAPDSPLSFIAARTGTGFGYYARYAGLVLFFMVMMYLPFRRKR